MKKLDYYNDIGGVIEIDNDLANSYITPSGLSVYEFYEDFTKTDSVYVIAPNALFVKSPAGIESNFNNTALSYDFNSGNT